MRKSNDTCYCDSIGKSFLELESQLLMSCAYQLVVVYLIISGICFSLRLVTMSHGFMIKFMTTFVHCDLLNMASLTIITLKAYLPHIEMDEQLLQKGMYVKVENFGI